MNNVSLSSGSVGVSSSSSDLHADMSFYALIYGLGAVAVVIAIVLRGVVFMTVRLSVGVNPQYKVQGTPPLLPLPPFPSCPLRSRLLKSSQGVWGAL